MDNEMKNYDAYCAGVFETNIEEVKKLSADDKMNMDFYQENLARVQKYLEPAKIVEFTLKRIPLNWKRGTWDNACLLVWRSETGFYFAKRHNNSQHLNIRS